MELAVSPCCSGHANSTIRGRYHLPTIAAYVSPPAAGGYYYYDYILAGVITFLAGQLAKTHELAHITRNFIHYT